MHIAILSDLHLEFAPFEPAPLDADVVVVAGDVHTGTHGLEWFRAHYPDHQVAYVVGNHEYYCQVAPKLLTTLRNMAKGTNINVLENDAVQIDGVTFLGCTLWTDFKLFANPQIAVQAAQAAMSDYSRIRVIPGYRKLRPADTIAWHTTSLRWLRQALHIYADQRTVVVTHHVPCTRSIAPQYADDLLTAAFASDLDTIVAESGAALWVHGHTHVASDYIHGTTRVICNPRGYPREQTGFRPQLVIEI